MVGTLRKTNLRGRYLLATLLAVVALLLGQVSPSVAYGADGDLTILAFTSDAHNMDNNTSANRTGTWLQKIADTYGQSVEAMAFGGDMGAASGSASSFWTHADAIMTQVSNKGVTGVYTTGNHEYNPGDGSYNNGGITSSSNQSVASRYKISAEGYNGSNYRIYCLGSRSWDSDYSGQISALESYLSSVGNDKPIFIITHFPLHYYNSRSTTGAADVITTLNAAADAGKKIVFLWGHNHTMSDTYYDQIYIPGDSIPTSSSDSSAKQIKFYYGGAGCMSDSEYGSGSASVKGKGLVVTIDSKNKLEFAYYNENGVNVTEKSSDGTNEAGHPYSEQDPTPIESVSISTKNNVDPAIVVGRSLQLQYSRVPKNATIKSVIWESSEPEVASVDQNGKVKGISEGTTTITVTVTDAFDTPKTATLDVTVTPRSGSDPEYILADSIEAGKSYIIVNAKSGNGYALTNNNGSIADTAVEIDGDALIVEDLDVADTLLFTAEGSGSTINSLSNDGYYLNASSSSSSGWGGWGGSATLSLTTTEPSGRPISYSSANKLTITGSSNTYYIYRSNSNGWTCSTSEGSGSSSSPREVYLFELIEAAGTDPVSGVSLNTTSLDLGQGDSEKLTATVSPKTAANKSVTWKSSNTSVATVNNGVVTAVAPGTATITVTTVDGNKTATCAVTVHAQVLVTYTLADTLEAGDDYIIANGNSGSVYVVSTDAGSSRQLKGISATVSGDQISIAEDDEAKVAFTSVANSNSSQGGIRLQNGSEYLYADSNSGLRMDSSSDATSSAKSWHYKAGSKNLLWFFKDTDSSDGYTDTSSTYKYYLECNSGVFTDNHVSTTNLDNTNTPKIYLYKKTGTTPIEVTDLTVSPTAASVEVGKTTTIKATVTPSSAKVSWSSNDTSVATVNNGTVTGVKAGTATITAAAGEKTATCTVTVTPRTTSTTTYVLTDTLEDGKKYLIVNAKSGNGYAVTNTASGSGSSAGLRGLEVTVNNNKIELEDEDAAKAAFTCQIKTSPNGADSAWFMMDGKYLYADSTNGLVVNDAQTGTSPSTGNDNKGKFWHYKADGKDLLWYFLDTDASDGYTDTSSTYKYYLQANSSGVYSAQHVSTTSLSNTTTPAIYLFAEDSTTPPTPHTHTLVATAAKDATCTEAGNTAYWTCSGCGKFFSDAEGKTEIQADSWVIAALGHKWKQTTSVWNEDHSSVEVTYVCENDPKHIEKVTSTDITSEEDEDGTTYTAKLKDPDGKETTVEDFVPSGEPQPSGQWKRLAGTNRLETMQAIVQEGFESSEYAVLSTGWKFPDALVASAVAGQLDCPVILTDPATLSTEAMAEIKRLGVKHVYIMGSDSTVTSTVESQLKLLKVEDVERIQGTDRQATSLAALKWLDSALGGNNYDGTVVIASGYSFPDALAIGPWCYRDSVPILLADANGELSADQWAALNGNEGVSTKAKNVIVLGGTDRVSQTTRNRIKGIVGEDNMVELRGSSRYETAFMIAAWEVSEQGMGAANVTVAKGTNFPDALAGAALDGSRASVMLLCDGNNEENNGPLLTFVYLMKDRVETGYVLGDENSVTKELWDTLNSYTSGV